MRFPLTLLAFVLFHCSLASGEAKKKDIRDYTDVDLERLYEQWEEGEEELPDDEKPEHLRPKPDIDVEKLKKTSHSPDDMMRSAKKGQSVMMFVSVVEVATTASSAAVGKSQRDFTEDRSKLWQSLLYNNHIDAQSFTIEDNRLLLMFKDGSQAWEARDFLVKQRDCLEVVLEGQMTKGEGASGGGKEEL